MLMKYRSISIKTAHPVIGRFGKPAKKQIAAKKVSGEMLDIAPEKLLKNELHHEKRQKRHQHTPPHAKNGTLILLLEVSLNELLKKKLILLQFPKHQLNPTFHRSNYNSPIPLT